MAFGNKSATSFGNKVAAASAAPAAGKKEFAPKLPGLYEGKEGSKVVAYSAPAKEDITITIPKGYRVKMFVNEKKTSENKQPNFDLAILPDRDSAS